MLTPEELFQFDLQGFLVLPGVLDPTLTTHCRDLLLTESTTHGDKGNFSRTFTPQGRLTELIDHPEVLRVLEQLIDRREERIRLESIHMAVKHYGECGVGPHAGGVTVNPNYAYRHHNGSIYAGMTRVVFEFNEVVPEGGGTVFLPGTHKANFPIPASLTGADYEEHFTGYQCPAGSLVFFSEAVCHAASTWRNQAHPRVAVLHAYNHIGVRHHPARFDPEALAKLSPKRRRYFNDVYHPQFDKPQWSQEPAPSLG